MAGRYGFADRPDGSGDVLFEQRAFHQLQQRHADDGGWVGGGDGHTCFQAQIRVRRAQYGREHQAQEDRAKGELAHLHVFGDIRLEFFYRFGWNDYLRTHGKDPYRHSDWLI